MGVTTPRNRAKRLVMLLGIASLAVASLGAASERDELTVADAVERRDTNAARALVDDGHDVNERQPDGATALHWAAHWDDLDTAKWLIAAGADVTAENDLGVTSLSLAAENGSGPMVTLLLEAGADANTTASNDEPVLLWAARSGSVEAVSALIEAGAEVDAREPTRGQTALMWAAAQQHSEVVRVLIEKGADPYARSAVRRHIVHIGNRYADRGNYNGVVEKDRGGYAPLLFAARLGAVDVGRVLLEHGANPDEVAADGTSALVLAAHSGQGEFARFLLEHGADPNAAGSGYTALHAAVLRDDLELVTALIDAGATVDKKLLRGTPTRYWGKDYAFSDLSVVGATPLWLAARYGDVEMVRALAAAGADPNFALSRPPRETPGRASAVERRLQSQYQVPDGTTVLIEAIRAHGGFGTGDRREVYLAEADRALIPEGYDDGITLETVKAAVELGADVNAADASGNTAVHRAVSQRLNDVIRYLAEAGADVNATNNEGQTPLATIAAPGGRQRYEEFDDDSGWSETAELLRQLGATE